MFFVLVICLLITFGASGKDFSSITMFCPTADYDITRYEAAVMIRDEIKQLGFDVVLKPLEFAVLMDEQRRAPEDKNYDIIVAGFSGKIERSDPDLFLYPHFHSSTAVYRGRNYSAYRNPEYDKIVEKQRVTMDMEKRRDYVLQAEEILMEDVPLITLWFVQLQQALNIRRWDSNSVPSTPEGIFSGWLFLEAKPLTEDAEFRIGGLSDIDTLNPLKNPAFHERALLRYIYDSLTIIRPNLEIELSGAKEINVINDTTIQVSLKDGLFFHDGEPVTPEDVVFTFNFLIDNEVAFFEAYLNSIQSVELVNDNIVFNLKEPYAGFMTNSLSLIPILPKHIWENVVEKEGLSHPDEVDNLPPIGSGPFKFDSQERGSYLKLTKFDEHWRAKDIGVEAINYIVFGHDEGQFAALEKEQIDMTAQGLMIDFIPRLKKLDFLELRSVDGLGNRYFSFNCAKPPFDDVKARQAVAHVIDRDEIIDVILAGYGLKGGPGVIISPANTYWAHPNPKIYELDIEKAKELLSEAGYRWDEDGLIYNPDK